MAKTTNKRSHENNKARMTARDRAMEVMAMLDNTFGYSARIDVICRAFGRHARATLDRAKRRAR